MTFTPPIILRETSLGTRCLLLIRVAGILVTISVPTHPRPARSLLPPQLLWSTSLPEETLALNRCLVSLSGALTPPKPETSLADRYIKTTASHRNPCCNNSYAGGNLAEASAPGRRLKSDALARKPTARSSDLPGGGGNTGAHVRSGGRRGISAILVGVREELTCTSADPSVVSHDEVSCLGIDRRRDDDQSHSMMRKRQKLAVEDNDDLRDSAPRPPPSKKAKSPPLSVPPSRNDSSAPSAAVADKNHDVVYAEQRERLSARRETGQAAMGNGTSERDDGNIGPDGKERLHLAVSDAPGNGQDGEELGNNKEKESLPTELREKMIAVAEKLTAARARGSTSMDVKGAAAAAVSLLQDTVSSSVHPSARRAFAQQQNQRARQQQQHPFEIVCKGLGLDKPPGKRRGEDSGGADDGCGDDVVMEVCSGFVTSALSLRNCLAFFSAVLVPRARALAGPATRLFVTAVSGIAKARPGAAIDGLVLPLLRDTDSAELGSAQCELCTRLIKQVRRWILLLLCKTASNW